MDYNWWYRILYTDEYSKFVRSIFYFLVFKKILEQEKIHTVVNPQNVCDVILDDVIEENPIVSIGIVRQNRFVQNLKYKIL